MTLRVEDISVDDIAHALSMKTRWGGACRSYYSVGQHAVLLSDWLGRQPQVSWQDQWDALHHDDVEAYLVDLQDPLRAVLPAYDQAEARGWTVIADVFGCSKSLSAVLIDADRRIRADEARVLMTTPSGGWGDHGGGLVPLGICIKPCSPEEAKTQWLAAFDRLQASRPAQRAAERVQ
jgi:hypothetical protein